MYKTRALNWWKPAVCGVSMLLYAAALLAEPMAQFSAGGVTIILHRDECKLKSEITNLPRRAVWLENGKEVEGCWGVIPQFGFVTMYFADKTSTGLPSQLFERVSET